MKNMTLVNVAKAVGGVLHTENMPDWICAGTTEAAGVTIDSRMMQEGFLFVATKGERVDGHSFIDSVFAAGAMGVVCEQAPQMPKGAYILVPDSFQALKDMAEFYRNQLDIKVVGITGSVGKTSTKEFVASVLSKKYNTLKTKGNFNNEIGLPLTVLSIHEACQVAVLEMGISDFGEMHRLSKIAKPDVCLLTNIGQCHLENLGTRDGILKAKSEIFDFMQENGKICLNGDDDKLATIEEVKGIKPIFFGTGDSNAVYATEYENLGLAGSRAVVHIRLNGKESQFIADIPLPGEHMLYNALAATTVGALFGLEIGQIQTGIKDVEPVGGRSHVIRTERFTLIDDCYNANPISMKAAIDLLDTTSMIAMTSRIDTTSMIAMTSRIDTTSRIATTSLGRKVAILGDMFELGTEEAALHSEVGAYVAKKEIDVVICIGNLCKNMYESAKAMQDSCLKLYYFKEKEAFFAEMNELLQDGDIVLIKASHGMHFEEIIKKLEGSEERSA